MAQTKREIKYLNKDFSQFRENLIEHAKNYFPNTYNDFNESSDIDLVVDFEEKDPFKYTDLYFNLKSKLEEILKRQVDLLEERGIKNSVFRQQLESTKVKIYGY